METNKIPIATLHVEAGERVRADKANAAWWDRIVWESQDVDVYLTGQWVTYGVACTIVEEYYPSQFGGVNIPGTKGREACSKPATDSRQLYAYAVAEMVATDGTGWALSPGVMVGFTEMDHPVYCSGVDTFYNGTYEGDRRVTASSSLDGTVYASCVHDSHVDCHGNPIGTRNEVARPGARPDAYGEFLQKGYGPEVNRSRHWKFTRA